MNAPNSNPNNQNPSFDFIVQPNGAVDPGHQKNKINKKIKILMVLVALTAVIAIAGALFSAHDNVQEDAAQRAATTEVNFENQDAIQAFLNKTHEAKYDEAYGYVVSGNDSVLSKDAYISEAVPLLEKLKLEECVFTIENNNEASNTYQCPTKSNNEPVNLEFIVGEETNRKKVIFFRIGADQ